MVASWTRPAPRRRPRSWCAPIARARRAPPSRCSSIRGPKRWPARTVTTSRAASTRGSRRWSCGSRCASRTSTGSSVLPSTRSPSDRSSSSAPATTRAPRGCPAPACSSSRSTTPRRRPRSARGSRRCPATRPRPRATWRVTSNARIRSTASPRRGSTRASRRCVIWEGVVPYLTEAAVRATATRLARGLDPRSLVAFDFVGKKLAGGQGSVGLRRGDAVVRRRARRAAAVRVRRYPAAALDCGFRWVRSLDFNELALELCGDYQRERMFRFQHVALAAARPPVAAWP